MSRKGLHNQYTWVMKVLDSCENPQQIETTEKLFQLYLKKWKNDLTYSHMSIITSNFEKEKKGKISKVGKKNKSFFAKMSQFFLF